MLQRTGLCQSDATLRLSSDFFRLCLTRRRGRPIVVENGSKSFLTLEDGMAWKSPKIREIAVGLEINSYACAEIK